VRLAQATASDSEAHLSGDLLALLALGAAARLLQDSADE